MIHVNITKADKTKWQKQFETMEEAEKYVKSLPVVNDWGHDDQWVDQKSDETTNSKEIEEKIAIIEEPIITPEGEEPAEPKPINYIIKKKTVYLLPKNYEVLIEEYVIPYQVLRQQEYLKEGCTVEALTLALFEDAVQDQEVEWLSPRIKEMQEKRLKVKNKIPKN